MTVVRTDGLSRQDLVELVERASTVDERLSGDFIPGEDTDAVVVEGRLRAWCRALGNGDWDRLERRLAFDGLDLGTPWFYQTIKLRNDRKAP